MFLDPFKNLKRPLSKKSSKLANCEIKCSSKHICDGSRYSNEIFHVLIYGLLFVLGRSLFHNAITIGSSIGFSIIDRSNQFGRQRVWGTIGSGITAFGTSRLYAHFKRNSIYIFTFLITSILSILITCFIRIPSDQSKELKSEENEMSVRENLNDLSDNDENKETITKKEIDLVNLSALLPLLKKMNVIVFLLTTFVWGMSFAALDPVSK